MNGRDRMFMDSTALVVWLTGSSALPHLKTLHPESAPPSFEGTGTLGAHSLSSPQLHELVGLRASVHSLLDEASPGLRQLAVAVHAV